MEKCVQCEATSDEYEIGSHSKEGRVCCKCVVDNLGGWDAWKEVKDKTGQPKMFQRDKEHLKAIDSFMDKYNRGKKK